MGQYKQMYIPALFSRVLLHLPAYDIISLSTPKDFMSLGFMQQGSQQDLPASIRESRYTFKGNDPPQETTFGYFLFISFQREAQIQGATHLESQELLLDFNSCIRDCTFLMMSFLAAASNGSPSDFS